MRKNLSKKKKKIDENDLNKNHSTIIVQFTRRLKGIIEWKM
jgi:hypothetical protein